MSFCRPGDPFNYNGKGIVVSVKQGFYEVRYYDWPDPVDVAMASIDQGRKEYLFDTLFERMQ